MKKALVLSCFLTACKPWVTRPIGEETSQRLDAAAYVDSIWNSKVVPYVRDHAAAWPTGGKLVQGEGKVVARGPLVLIDMPPYDGKADVAIPAGPVIRGTALRDALPFIEFSQFVNQLEYARVGNELNARAVREMPPLAVGEVVHFAGVMTPGQPPEIVPVAADVRRPD